MVSCIPLTFLRLDVELADGLILLLGVCRLHGQGLSGDECSRLFQFLLTVVDSCRQGSADMPHIFSCNIVNWASLQNTLFGLDFLTTAVDW